VITSAEFHPSHCHTLAYSSSKGSIRLIDLRQSALCDSHSKLFEEQDVPSSRSFFTEIIASISDVKFARDGRYMLSRDYMTLKLWDTNMDSGPVATFQVHEHLRPKLCDLYENDSIFDKFECCLSGDGQRVATGSYSNLFRVFGCAPGSTDATTLEASKNPMRRQVQTPSRPSRSLSSITRVVRRATLNPSEHLIERLKSAEGEVSVATLRELKNEIIRNPTRKLSRCHLCRFLLLNHRLQLQQFQEASAVIESFSFGFDDGISLLFRLVWRCRCNDIILLLGYSLFELGYSLFEHREGESVWYMRPSSNPKEKL
ncbi:hypothetical protein KSS87_004220, partial [Heliosperma pusillum]